MLPPCTRDPEGLALLAACKENPVDKAPKLILSDWLEEQGEEDVARCLRESLSGGGKTVPLATRAQERWQPINACRDGWLCLRTDEDSIERKLTELNDCEWFGAISYANLKAEIARRFIQAQPALRHVVAVESSTGWPFPINHSSDSAEFQHLSNLDFHHSQLDAEDIEALCTDRRVTRLRELRLGSSRLHTDCLKYLEAAPWMSKLALLEYSGYAFGRESLSRFFSGPALQEIEALSVDEAGSGNEVIRTIADHQSTPRLRLLSMSQMSLHTRALRALLKCFANHRLQMLDVSNNFFGDHGARLIAKWAGLGEVSQLRLNNVGLGSDGLQALTESKRTTNIRSLDLGDNPALDEKHLENLLRFENEKLKLLRMTRCELGERSLANFACWPMLEKLQMLDLRSNRMGERGLTSLAEAKCSSLTWLCLDENFLGDAGVIHLANSSNLNSVTHLTLAFNGIRNQGATAMASASQLGKLRLLNMNGNPLGDEGITALAASEWLSVIERLHLSQTEMTDEALKKLLDSPNMTQLQELNLWGNHITDAGADALANCQQLESLTDLFISTEHLTDRGRKMLKNSPHLRHTLIHW